jgi:hypothetical protein
MSAPVAGTATSAAVLGAGTWNASVAAMVRALLVVAQVSRTVPTGLNGWRSDPSGYEPEEGTVSSNQAARQYGAA